MSKEDDMKLWHQKLGGMKRAIYVETVRGLPELDIKETICGECQIGKQTKMSHPK
ncbi:gag-pol polyprotein, partial [Trifolium medium]|nr:gag-pol polyprotein [Trifolium medium]